MKNMKIYLTTDTHLGHDNMVDWCGRPENHSELILKELAKLPTEGLLIHLGDVCIGNDEYWHDELMKSIGVYMTRVLVRGNHDHKSDSWYLERGWDFVCDAFEAKYFGKKILFTHKPVLIPDHVDFNIHGHFHNSDHRSKEEEVKKLYEKRHLLLAIENTQYKPVSLEKILKQANK